MKSYAPALRLSMAVLISPTPVMTMMAASSIHRAGVLEEVEAVHHGHSDVGEGEGWAFALEGFEAFAPVGRHAGLVAVGEEDFTEGAPDFARRPPR
jgi:hypothetical protein